MAPLEKVRGTEPAVAKPAPKQDSPEPKHDDKPPARGSSGDEHRAAPARDADAGTRELGAHPPRSKHAAGGPAAERPATTDPAPAKHPDDATTRELSREAARNRDARHEWNPDAPLSDGRNAHHSNTPDEMRDALRGDYNWLEGDLRLDDHGHPVMAHDSDAEGDGLHLDQWLEIGRNGGRGMKVDVKEAESIPQLLDALEASGIEDGRLMINVQTSQVDDDRIREMRRRFPNAYIAINPASDHNDYSDDNLDEAIHQADVAGGRVAFPLRWDMASDHAIERLRPHGNVSIWTAESHGTPDDTAAEVKDLRERGVDGVIDLGPPSSFGQKLIQLFKNGAFEVLGEDPVRGGASMLGELALSPAFFAWRHGGDILDGARSVGSKALDIGEDALDTAGDLAHGAVDGAREAASHLPVVGGLFG
jgi:glycerophosphoryl diester phosphodiesterase